MLARRAQIVTVLFLAAACLAAFVGVTTSEARSADPLCSDGGPPTVEQRPTLPEKPSGPQLVIACGSDRHELDSGRRSGRSYTALNGWVRPDVARVEVRYHRRNEKPITHANATVAQVDGELLSSLDQTTPFGRFAVVLPGCTVPQGLRVLAFDSVGKLFGSERGRKSGSGRPCRPGG
jgi:hypothetical protein